MQEAVNFTAVVGAIIALLAAYSLWASRERKGLRPKKAPARGQFIERSQRAPDADNVNGVGRATHRRVNRFLRQVPYETNLPRRGNHFRRSAKTAGNDHGPSSGA